jgi:hypothetical protein
MPSESDRFLQHSLEAWRDEPDQLRAVMHLPRQADLSVRYSSGVERDDHTSASTAAPPVTLVTDLRLDELPEADLSRRVLGLRQCRRRAIGAEPRIARMAVSLEGRTSGAGARG